MVLKRKFQPNSCLDTISEATDHSFAQFTQMLTNIDTDLQKEREDCREKALQATDAIRNCNKNYCDKHSFKPTKYNEGVYVLVRIRALHQA